MNSDLVIEIVGYLGSALVVVSLTRTSLLKLRIFGLIGAIIFVIYSVIIEAYPIALVNVLIVGIHIFFLRNLLSKKSEFFDSLHVRADSRYLEYFIKFHEDDIAGYRPDFRFEAHDDQVRVFILRDLVPAGLLIGKKCDDHSFEVELDFVIPKYRDFRIAEFLYSKRSGVFTDPQCARVWSRPGSEINTTYLDRMGFAQATDSEGSPIYVKDLATLQR